jgi:Skp family chaperone for outer membrane proteins
MAQEELATKKAEIDAYAPLAEKVADAIEKQRQSEIDKLSEVNDSINSTNERLVSKIQEQIDTDRQEREEQKMKDDLSNMYSQQAYLAMNTSGANATQMLDNEKAI